MKRRLSTYSGFTLIELLVVISIIAMLASVILVSLQSVRDKGRIARALLFDNHNYQTFGADSVFHYDFSEGAGVPTSIGSGQPSFSVAHCLPVYDASCADAYSSMGDTPAGYGYSYILNKTGSVQNHDSDPIVLTFNQPILLTDKTVSAWIKPSATSPANSGMVVELTCSAACGAGAAGQFGLKMYVDASMSTSYYDQVYVGDGNIPFDIYSVHIPVNQWTLITISYNASTYTYLLFIDGVQQTNLLSGPGPTVHTLPYGGLVNTITIGDEYAPGYPFYGNVYNVAVYNKPLF